MKYADTVRCLAGRDLYIIFDEDRIYEITSQKPSDTQACDIFHKFRYIKDYLADHTARPTLDEAMKDFDLSWVTPLQMDIYKALATIPSGSTISYKGLAELSGHPKAARVVGNTMAKNRFLIVLPCHRVITSNGKLGGFSGGLYFKIALLACEGNDGF